MTECGADMGRAARRTRGLPPQQAVEVLRWSGLLMIGGAGRNSGKTRLSCALISRFRTRVPIVGLKVTTIRQREDPCPRGGDGCGVCSSLDTNYRITEETGEPPGKDTSLMVAAGAHRVYWLRVLREHLSEGAAALAGLVEPGELCICESNSLRHVVQPDLFLITRAKGSSRIKRTSREVMELADRLVFSDADGFDISLDDFQIDGGRWVLRSATRRVERDA